MIVEGIKRTPRLIKNIKTFQENPDLLNYELNTFDKVIYFLAMYAENTEPEDAASFIKIISDLCYLKNIFQNFYEEDEINFLKGMKTNEVK